MRHSVHLVMLALLPVAACGVVENELAIDTGDGCPKDFEPELINIDVVRTRIHFAFDESTYWAHWVHVRPISDHEYAWMSAEPGLLYTTGQDWSEDLFGEGGYADTSRVPEVLFSEFDDPLTIDCFGYATTGWGEPPAEPDATTVLLPGLVNEPLLLPPMPENLSLTSPDIHHLVDAGEDPWTWIWPPLEERRDGTLTTLIIIFAEAGDSTHQTLLRPDRSAGTASIDPDIWRALRWSDPTFLYHFTYARGEQRSFDGGVVTTWSVDNLVGYARVEP